jgi:hypothetical protein
MKEDEPSSPKPDPYSNEALLELGRKFHEWATPGSEAWTSTSAQLAAELSPIIGKGPASAQELAKAKSPSRNFLRNCIAF